MQSQKAAPWNWSDVRKFTTDFSAEEDIRLISSFPNPFRDKVTITFRAIRAGHVTIAIYNLLGEKVADLVSRKCEMGFYTTTMGRPRLSERHLFCVLPEGQYAPNVQTFIM